MSEYNLYDVVLELNSLSKLKDGFPIIYNTEKGKQKVDELKEKDGIAITAIGNSNQGKSFILSRISEIEIPSSHSVNTKGLSIIFPDNLSKNDSNKRYIILDTEGSQNAITISEEDREVIYGLKELEKIEKIEETSRDKQMTENFLQGFALDSAQVVIAVVGQLTFQDQKFLNRIKDVCKNKNLFIVHNLMFLEKKEEVENHIKDVIESSLFFNLEKQNMIVFTNSENKEEKKEKEENEKKEKEENEKDTVNRIIYVESSNSGKKESHIIHLILAKEGSEAGDYYNKSTISYLRESVIAIPKQKKFDILEKFKKYLYSTSSEYFDFVTLKKNELENKNENEKGKEKENVQESEKEKKKEKEKEKDQESEKEKENDKEENDKEKVQVIEKKNIIVENDNRIRVDVPFNLNLKKCFTDEIGITSYKGLMTTPPFGYYKKDDTFVIQIEYCGKLEKNYIVKKNILNGQYKFTIIGKTVENKTKGIIGNVEEGNFILSFSVGLDFITIKSNNYKEKNNEKDGVLNIIYEISDVKNDDNEQNLGDDDDWDNDDISKPEKN